MIPDVDGGMHSTSRRKALVCGAGGFIGGYLVDKLKQEGYWVRGVDIKGTARNADQFMYADLREPHNCIAALHGGYDEVYQLAANLGGMGYIPFQECEIMHDNALININMIHTSAEAGVSRYFLSSSVCVYPDMGPNDPMIAEDGAYPAMPDNEYGWEKLYAERMALAYGRRYPMVVRIARFKSVVGVYSSLDYTRAKVLPALCRKVAEAEDDSELEIWGDGSAIRTHTYVTDTVDGVYRLMQSDLEGPVNIGSSEYLTINELADLIIEVSGKNLCKKYIPGPTGVRARNFSTERICSLGWVPMVSVREAIERIYPWVVEEVAWCKQTS